MKRTVTFDGISRYSFLCKEFNQQRKGKDSKERHADLINVIIGDTSYIFDLKPPKKCLHQLNYIDTLNKIDEPCNTGLPSYVRTENDRLF